MAAAMIEVEGISKRFGAVQVLDNLTFSVAPSEKLALIGPSGSGKTTILRVLMTLETIDSGRHPNRRRAAVPRGARGAAGAGERKPSPSHA